MPDLAEQLITISPSTNKPILTRNGLSSADIALLPIKAERAFGIYKTTSLKERQQIINKALDFLLAKQDVLAMELTEQMGRPIAYTAKEITTAVARGRYLVKVSEDALKDTPGEPEQGFRRYIRKVPVGPVLILFAWNASGSIFICLPRRFTNHPTVSVSDPCQLLDTSTACRGHCHS